MTRIFVLSPEFVEFIPDKLKDGILYISMIYATASHKCCCGCGNEVVTPFSGTDWSLTFDGKTISLFPSIGNWSFKCQSHYWIKNNQVEWSYKMTRKEIAVGRALDLRAKDVQYGSPSEEAIKKEKGEVPTQKVKVETWRKLLKRWLK